LGLIEIGLAVAGSLAVLFIIVGGIRYITAYGNEEQTESAKKTLTNAIIGVVIVILAFVIVRVIVNALVFGGGGT
jgi:glucose uptake protein GlcU